MLGYRVRGIHAAVSLRQRPSRQLYRTYSSTSSESRPKVSRLGFTLGAGILGIVAGTSYLYLYSRPKNVPCPRQLEGIQSLDEADFPGNPSIHHPVKALDLQAANERIRQDAHSFLFDSKDGRQGRIDVASVHSNSPVEDKWSVRVGKGADNSSTLYAGVYDGHAGWATSAVLQHSLIPYVSAALQSLAGAATSSNIVAAAIKKAFVRLDDEILDEAKTAVEAGHEPGSPDVVAANAAAAAGSCALLCIYSPQSSVLHTAVTGDSRAVLGSWSSSVGKFHAEALSVDQTGFNEDEVRRLDAAHPGESDDMIDKKSGRLLGIAVTRAFGDNRWKWTKELLEHAQTKYHGYGPRPKAKTPPYLTAEPEVTSRTVQTQDFAILASDGLWDVLSNEAAVDCVSRWIAARRKGQPETVEDLGSSTALDDNGLLSFRATLEQFAIEDLDNAAVCLAKNALGGRRRAMFRGALTVPAPLSRNVRDDITVQVIFFRDPFGKS